MIKFYNKAVEDAAIEYFLDDTYLQSGFFTVDRPSSETDRVRYPDEYAEFMSSLVKPAKKSAKKSKPKVEDLGGEDQQVEVDLEVQDLS